MWTGSSWLGIYRTEDSCENSNEVSGSVQYGEFYQQLSDYRLIFKKCSAARYYSVIYTVMEYDHLVIYTVMEYDHLLGNDSVNTA
jgi:hypothetical protein